MTNYNKSYKLKPTRGALKIRPPIPAFAATKKTVLTAIAMVSFLSSVFTDVIYVKSDATGANSGVSWNDAFSNLDAALSAANSGDQIWVATGTYKPSIKHVGTTERGMAFQLKNGVSAYGGFNATETGLGQRDTTANPCILSGDIGYKNDSSDNTYHIFYHPSGLNLDNTAILDGFILEYANGDLTDGTGVTENGGAVHNINSSPAFRNCTFRNNRAFGKGGAAYNAGSALPIFENCIFEDNTAKYGGGIYNLDSGASFSNCEFSGNTGSPGYGGAIVNENSDISVEKCAFLENKSNSFYGAGIFNLSSSPKITNSTFSKNNGGAIYNHSSSPKVVNCLFVQNSSLSKGGAFFNISTTDLSSSPEIVNCTFYANTAPAGNEIYNGSLSSPLIRNSIICKDPGSTGGNLVYNYDSGAKPVFSYCNIEGGINGAGFAGTLSSLDGGGNIDKDSLFADISLPEGNDHVFGTKDDGLHLLKGSPCIDSGNSGFNSEPYDLTGISRITGAAIDIGAYEGGNSAFTLAFAAGPNGLLTGSTSQIVLESCDSLPVSAVPSTGYNFSSWSGDYTGTENPLAIKAVMKDMSFTANFAINTYTVTFIAGENGTLEGKLEQQVTFGGKCTQILAVPSTGYYFSGWSGDYTDTNNPLILSNVSSDMTIVANFAKITYELTMAVSPALAGTCTPTGTTTVDIAIPVNISATPAVAYHFVQWTANPPENATFAELPQNGQAVNANVTLSGNCTVTANFAINSYSVTFTAGAHGNIIGETEQEISQGGSSSSVTASADVGYKFSGWSGDYSGNENPLVLNNLSKDMAISASFIPEKYSVKFKTDGTKGASLSGETTQEVAYAENSTPVTANPPLGLSFLNWTVSGILYSADNPLTISNVTKAIEVTANFTSSVTLVVVATPSGAGTLSPVEGEHAVETFVPFEISAIPAGGFAFQSWKLSGKGLIGNKNSAQTTLTIYATATITANFTDLFQEMTMTALPPEGGSTLPAPGTIEVPTGEWQSIKAIPGESYHFVEWSAEPADFAEFASAVLEETNVRLTGNCQITANFAKTPETAQLILAVSPEGAGTVSPTEASTVNTGETTNISATPEDGYYFLEWTADNGAIEFADASQPDTSVAIYGNTVITANFAEDIKTTPGKTHEIKSDSAGLANFAKNPRFYSLYQRPYGCTKKATLRNCSKISTPLSSMMLEWTKRISLYDKSKWSRKATCLQNIAAHPQSPLKTNLFITAADSFGKTAKDFDTGIPIYLVPPNIDGVYDIGGNSVTTAGNSETITIKGIFFGTKAPQIFLEFPVYEKDETTLKSINLLRLKTSGTLKYKDARGSDKKSCMETSTGASEITVKMPSEWRKGWNHGDNHNIVIDNKVGRASVEFKTYQ